MLCLWLKLHKSTYTNEIITGFSFSPSKYEKVKYPEFENISYAGTYVNPKEKSANKKGKDQFWIWFDIFNIYVYFDKFVALRTKKNIKQHKV